MITACSTVFAPWVVATALSIAVVSAAGVGIALRAGKLSPFPKAPQRQQLFDVVATLSAAFKLNKKPSIVVKDDRNIPVPLRDKYFFGESDMNIVGVTATTLDNFKDNPTTRFALAHELSHVKMERFSIFKKIFFQTAAKLFNLGAVVGGIASIFGAGGAFFAAGLGAPAILGIGAAGYIVTKFFEKFASRAQENRCDRNAVYVTQTGEGGIAFFKSLPDDYSRAGKKIQLKRKFDRATGHIFSTHPDPAARLHRVQRTAEKLLRYAPPAV